MPCCIHYRGGYKYQLRRPYTLNVAVNPASEIAIGTFIILTPDGTLTIGQGYAWDGPSGPTVDTKNFMRGSLVHDALYQLMRNGLLDEEQWRKPADQELERICREDGMFWLRRRWVYAAVRWFAKQSASTESKKSDVTAPNNCEECDGATSG